MGYRSPARCLLLRPTPFHGSTAWSHHPCVIDVLSTIDTDGAALPPARCDIYTFCRYFQLACAHRSHYRSVPIDRLSRRPLPWLMVIFQLSICPHSFWLICLFHFIFSAPSSLCRSLSLTPRTVAPAALKSVWPSFAAGLFCQC